MDYLTGVDLPVIEDADHHLLDAPAPDYTVATVRRAFIVWLYSGQKNHFRDVCDYYHRLEKLEEKMSPEQREASRHHEFTLFNHPPPTSLFLKKHYPTLYTQTYIDNHYLRKIEAIKNHYVYENLIKAKGGTGLGNPGGAEVTSGATQQEIVEASQTIKNYCLKHKVSVKEFLDSFKEYAKKCGVKCTIGNAEAYIKKKMVEKELDLVVEYSESVKKTTVEVKENVTDQKCEENKNFYDECRIIAESTVKDLIDFNDSEDKTKIKNKKTSYIKHSKAKNTVRVDNESLNDKENRVYKVQRTETKDDALVKEDLEDSFKSIEDCDDSCVIRHSGIKEVDLNVNGETKPVTLLKRDRKHEANMKVLNSSFQDLSLMNIQT